MPSEIFAIVVPVYLCAAVGFLWARLGRAFDTVLVTDLIMGVGAPCLVFSSLVSYEIQFAEAVEMIAATTVAIACMAGVSAIVLGVARIPLNTFLAPLTFGNTGNMGIPLCYFAFGEAGLSLAICVFAVTSVLHFTVGQAIWSGRAGWADVLRTPLVWAAVLALILMATGWGGAPWLTRTTSLLGSFTVPLMQLTLGVSLARLGVVRPGRSLALALVKLFVGIGVGLAVAGLFDLEGVAAGVLILACAMPAAVFNYMFAVRYQRSPGDVASLVVVSTLLAALAVPVLMALLLPESS
ncbi:MAG TPA: AEC family transporter [Myxococcales bacterium]|nr:AEC family transporter [Myxococcales bacterium]HIL02297.1 AEC family transporter [Myxococcales bacterium]